MEAVRNLFSEHFATIKGVTGLTLSALAAHISTALTIIVLSLTAWNLILEIRKKSKKD